MKVEDFADRIYSKDGIWFSTENKEVSYPKEGNASCYEIEQDSFWFRHRNKCIIELVKTYSKNEIFFDVGGGNGFVAKGLEENKIQTVLVEPGIEGALNAKKRGLKNIICATFEEAGFKSSSAKAIGLFDVVEHIGDDNSFLKSIQHILAEEGLVYITVPAFNFLWSKEDVDAGHYKRYTLNQMENLLHDTGFNVVYSTYIFSILPIPVFLFRKIPYLLNLKQTANKLDKHKEEHSQNKGALTNILDKIWSWELSCIKKKKKISVGGSCLIVARKIEANNRSL